MTELLPQSVEYAIGDRARVMSRLRREPERAGHTVRGFAPKDRSHLFHVEHRPGANPGYR